VVNSTPRPHFTPGEDPVPILQEAGWAPGPVWTGGKSRPHRDSIPDRPARSQSLYRLSYVTSRLEKVKRWENFNLVSSNNVNAASSELHEVGTKSFSPNDAVRNSVLVDVLE